MPSMILSKKGHDFYFINSFLTQNLFCGMVGGIFYFFPQTSLALPHFYFGLLLFLYFKLYVRRDALSCQSALSGFGSHFLAPLGEFLLVNFPLSYLLSLLSH